MSKFYGVIRGSRGEATRTGTAASGLETIAASWAGAISVRVYEDHDGVERFQVEMIHWRGVGDACVIADGAMGDARSVALRGPA